MTTRAQLDASVRSVRTLGGVECEPTPRGSIEFLGVVVIGLLVWALPEFLFVRFARALARGCGGR